MKNITKYICFLILILMALSCKEKNQKSVSGFELDTIKLKYAKVFEVYKTDSISKIVIKNPWQKAENVKFEYFLIKKNSSTEFNLSDKNVFEVPVERVVCFSTTHIGYIDLLGKNSSIVGLAGTQYVYNPEIVEKIIKNEISDVGYDQNVNYEIILKLKPDVVFLYGIESDVSTRIEKLNSLGIKTVVVGEYLEQTPLAKAEWIKFFSLFFDNFDVAEIEFNKIETDYNNLLKISDTISVKPKILINVPYNGIWYLPGGKSFMVNFITDAGGIYPWSDNQSTESFSLEFENIFLKSKDAEILINPGIYSSISEVTAVDKRISEISAIKNKDVYNNNKLINKKGGNDFWESGNVKPHVILKDLIKIFHPDIFSEDSLIYYKKLD